MDPDLLQRLLAFFGMAMSQDEMTPKVKERNEDFTQFLESPFVTDTLNTLVGGEPGFVLRMPLLDAQGMAHPLGDFILMNQQNPDPSAYIHEMGHLFRFRKVDPALLQAVGKRFGETIPNTYESTNKDEQFAVAFKTAMDVIRRSGARNFEGNLESADSLTPGTREIAKYILSTPIYENHPLNQASGTP